PADQFEGRDPYETVTVEDLRQFKEDHQKTLEQERMYQDQYQRKQRIDSSIDRAKGSYADFDEMYEYAKKVYTPEELGAIGATKDPGDLVYRMVKARPEIQAKESTTQKATTVEKTVAAINERMNSSGTLSDVGGSDRLLDQVKKWDQMNPNSQDFDDELERVKRLPKLGE
ncbi:MAG: hypothetical protein GY845_37570, partial [Planctomycetes bacterium]|nr:hypothetical protein [Planctomycetota bacterium]